MIEMWRCASCGWIGANTKRVLVKHANGYTDRVCPSCKSADVFENDEVAWALAAEEKIKVRR